jgi:hypothetical protein
MVHEETTLSPTAFLQSLAPLKSFAARKRACDARWPKIGAGSSRIVYDLGNGTVLKLAKNQKGIAQNETEADHCMRQWHGDVLAQTLAYDPDARWIVQQYAAKARKADFLAQFGVSLEEIGIWLAAQCFPYNRWRTCEEATQTRLQDHERFADIVTCALNFDLHCGDMGRLSSWGLVNNQLVLKDYGLTRSNYEEYYARKHARNPVW